MALLERDFAADVLERIILEALSVVDVTVRAGRHYEVVSALHALERREEFVSGPAAARAPAHANRALRDVAEKVLVPADGTPSARREELDEVASDPRLQAVDVGDALLLPCLSPAEDAESGLAGYVDETGKWVIQPVFDNSQLGSFHEGSAWVYRQEQRLLIDKTGNILYAEPIRRWVADDDG